MAASHISNRVLGRATPEKAAAAPVTPGAPRAAAQPAADRFDRQATAPAGSAVLAVAPAPLNAPDAAAQAFAQRSALGKIGTGWGRTVAAAPGHAWALTVAVANVAVHPFASVGKAWTHLKTSPMRVVVPVAATVGMVALSVVAPRTMRVVGWAMTASLALVPTWRFARAGSAAELHGDADAASKQLVHAGATWLAWSAAGKAVKWGLERWGAPTGPRGSEGYSANRGDKPRAVPARSGEGGAVNPDDLDFAAIRNDHVAAKKLAREAREAVKLGLFEEARAVEAGLTRPQFEGRLRSQAGAPLREVYAQQVRQRMHAGYLEAHGVQNPGRLAAEDLVTVRRYLQDIDDGYDLADAVKGVNVGLRSTARTGQGVTAAAEAWLWRERGVPRRDFEALTAFLKPEELKRVRRFTDGIATGRTGTYLRTAAADAKAALTAGQRPDALAFETAIARRLAGDTGLVLPATAGPDHRTILSLLRDIDVEGPRSAQTLKAALNRAIAGGERDYLRLADAGNRAFLAELGVEGPVLEKLTRGTRAWREAFPQVPAAEAQAAQVRLLRDVLHVLPAAEREGAIAALSTRGTHLATFQEALTPHLADRIDGLLLGEASLGKLLRADTPVIQQANLVASLARLPEPVRAATFGQLSGRSTARQAEVLGRLATTIESTFDVRVHRAPGTFPDKGWGYDKHVGDWTVQGLLDLHNGLARMAPEGVLPKAVRGTTFVRMASEAEGLSMTPKTIRKAVPATPLHARPGAAAYAGGTYGEAITNARGKDIVSLHDTALRAASADEIAGISPGEGTIVHEIGHAIQLGGPAGKRWDVRGVAERQAVAEWSTLSRWHEKDGAVADAWFGDVRYYKDPSIRVRAPREVPTNYGLTDPIEDFAEYTRYFYNDPSTAMRLSPEKFLYFNQLVGSPYAAARVEAVAASTGLGAKALRAAERTMREKIATAVAGAVERPSHYVAEPLAARP